VIVLFLYFLFAANDFDTSATGRSTGLHDVHMPEVISLPVTTELSVIVREQISFGHKVEFSELFFHPCVILVH
jgi:hypothetical protein